KTSTTCHACRPRWPPPTSWESSCSRSSWRCSPRACRRGAAPASIRWRPCAMSDRRPGVFSSVERLVALRYLQSRRQGRGPSFTALVSLVGIALGVGVLILVMSGMNGLRHDLLERILGVDPHLRIDRPDATLDKYDALAERVAALPGVARAEPAVN